MILVIVDSHSKWTEALLVNSATSHATIEKLQSVFATRGLPEVLVSDNETAFTSEEFPGIQHLTSVPYHPASNGLAKRAVQTSRVLYGKMWERLVWIVRFRSFCSDTELHHIQLLASHQLNSCRDGGLVRASIFSSRTSQGRSDRDRQIRRLDMIVIAILVTLLWDNQSGSRAFLWVDHGYLGLLSEPSRERFTVCLQDGRTMDRHIDYIQPRFATPQDEPAQRPVIPATDLLEDKNPPMLPDSPSANAVK